MKKERNITLHTAQLIYDIENKLHLLGVNREAGNTPEGVSHIQADERTEHRNQITRSLQNAVGALHHALHEYLLRIEKSSAENSLDNPAQYSIVLSMPSNFNDAVLGSLTALLHQYVVNTALVDWLLITDKADAAEYATAAAANLKEIDAALSKRTRPVRPTYSA